MHLKFSLALNENLDHNIMKMDGWTTYAAVAIVSIYTLIAETNQMKN